jgi:signal peptidase I
MVIKFPGDPDHKKYIKRLIGLPGEHIVIKNNQLFINDKLIQEPYIKLPAEENLPGYYEKQEWEAEALKLHAKGKVLVKPDTDVTLGKDDYFLMGDNRENSNDSRKWFAASKSDMIGPVRFILGQIVTKPNCVSLCLPSFTFKDWGPVVNPYY